ncbi:MAG: Uma2 family endonuclease [Gammaproteobacteria bacterium]
MLTSAQSPHRYRLTAGDYHRMGEAGIFAEGDRVELIEGEIIEMAPIGSQHAACVARLQKLLERSAGDQAIIWVQNPVVLNDHSEPEPDICLLRPRRDFYASAHPHPADVLLIIEVADTSLAYDRDVKLPLYARQGIPEAWIVELENKCVHVFTDATSTGYQETQTLANPAVRKLEALPDCPVDLSGLF